METMFEVLDQVALVVGAAQVREANRRVWAEARIGRDSVAFEPVRNRILSDIRGAQKAGMLIWGIRWSERRGMAVFRASDLVRR